MTRAETLSWLLEGDVSVQYQTYRDLLGKESPDLQARIPREGWGARFLAQRGRNGHWGDHFYQPKWTSTHYTLLDIRYLNPPRNIKEVQETILRVAKDGMGYRASEFKGPQGARKDLCVNGMFLNYATYFGLEDELLHTVIDYLIDEQMGDGGFNCRSIRSKCVHSSVHSTISIMEGLWEYMKNGYRYRLEEVIRAYEEAGEFLLMHRLFKSDKTNKIIHPSFLTLSYPGRWKYNILRALDHFQYSDWKWDERMRDAIEVLLKKRRSDGRWNLQPKHQGQVHFDMEKGGQPSRWNTLRAIRVLDKYTL